MKLLLTVYKKDYSSIKTPLPLNHLSNSNFQYIEATLVIPSNPDLVQI